MTDETVEALQARVAELERRLQESEDASALWQRVFDEAPLAIQVFDGEGTSQALNKEMCRSLGIPDPSGSIGKYNIFADAISQSIGLPEKFRKAYAGEVVDVPPYELDLGKFSELYGTPDVKVWWEYTLFPLRDADGCVNRVVSFLKDVTERVRLERALVSAQRHESLATLAGGIAHDFNNLLASILANASLARMDLQNSHAVAESLEAIRGTSEVAAELTRQLLAYAGKGRFVVEPLDFNQLVRDMAQILRVTLTGRGMLQLRLADDLPAVRVDTAQARQVLLNLLQNAVDALEPSGGVVTVTTSVVDADADYLSGSHGTDETSPGRYVVVEVSDDGVGMDAATVARVFDPFFTTKPTGNGLGMAAVLGILRGHKGALRIYTEPGCGTTVRALWPLAGEGATTAKEHTEAPLSGVQGHVLVVDDEPAIRRVAQRILERGGFRVTTAGGGEKAIECFGADRPDLVLLDLTMPGLNGAETFRELRQRDPNVRVILTSGFNEQDTTNQFAGKGLAGFIQKPYQARALLDLVERLILNDSGQ